MNETYWKGKEATAVSVTGPLANCSDAPEDGPIKVLIVAESGESLLLSLPEEFVGDAWKSGEQLRDVLDNGGIAVLPKNSYLTRIV